MVSGTEQSRAESAPTPQLKRDFTLFSAFSLAFAYISPIVAVYGVFALGVGLVGPGYWLAIPVALGGQLLVAYALGEIASKHPHEGSLYAWAGRLLGPTYGWFTGWAYVWTVLIALVTVAVGGAQFWGAALGIDLSDKWALIGGSLAVLAFATASNLWSRRMLRVMIAVSITAEIIGSIGLGLILLIGYHVNPLSAIFGDGPGSASGMSASSWLLAIALAGWSFLGFESSGAIAEEVEDAERNVPKALRYSLLAIAAIVLFASLALILSIPDLKAVLAGKDTDPVSTTLTTHLGSGLTRVAEGIFALGFTACALGLQTGISRVIWAFARDRALPAAGWLRQLSKRHQTPANALAVTTVIPLPILLLTGSNVYNVLVGYTIGGWYLTFLLVLLAAVIVRIRGDWKSGPFSLGRLSAVILGAAFLWSLFETVNDAWPRASLNGPHWYLQWAVVLVAIALAVLGAIVYATVKLGMTRAADNATP